MSGLLPEYAPDFKRTRSILDPASGMAGTRGKVANKWLVDRMLDCYSVYFIRADVNVKIGYAKDLASRMRGVQVGNPYEIQLDAVLLVDTELTARRIEAALHKRATQDGLRRRNEWFTLTELDVANLVKWAKAYYPENITKAQVIRR